MVDAGHVEPLEDIGECMTVTVEVKLLDSWTKQHQRGILRDRYGGSARFVSWSRTDPPTFEENEWYQLSGLKVSQFKDEKELVWTTDSTAQQLTSAPSVMELAQRDSGTIDQSIIGMDSSATNKNEASLTGSDESTTESGDTRSEHSSDSTDNQQLFGEPMFQEVLSALAILEHPASTAQIANEIDTSTTGAYDRLRTLEAEGKVIKTDDDEADMWELIS